MINFDLLKKELHFTVARSSGSGGQNVNKVNTKVELFFDIANSKELSHDEKAKVLEKAANKISNEQILHLSHQTERSQLGNKEKVIEKFVRLIQSCVKVAKKRKATKPTKSSKTERVDTKKRRSTIKTLRQRVNE